MSKDGTCVVCGKPKDDKGRCFDCFVKYSYYVGISVGGDITGVTTTYPPPPETPEEANTCDLCEKFTQFFYFDQRVLDCLASDDAIPHLCQTCVGLFIITAEFKRKSNE